MGVTQAIKALENSNLSDFSDDEAGFDTNVREEFINGQTSESDDNDEPLAAIAAEHVKVSAKSAWKSTAV